MMCTLSINLTSNFICNNSLRSPINSRNTEVKNNLLNNRTIVVESKFAFVFRLFIGVLSELGN